MMRDSSKAGIVYSTESGRMCPACGNAVDQCSCCGKAQAPKGDGRVRVGRITKGRRGKGVTVITGLALDEAGLEKLSRKLKEKCGAGGTLKDGIIEIQGDHRDRLVEELKRQGFDAKRSGG